MILEFLLSFYNGFLKLVFGIERKVVMVTGLDNAGKTTILYRLKEAIAKEESRSEPYKYMETVQYNNIIFNFVDLGGMEPNYNLKNQFIQKADLIIFVIDSYDRCRIDEVKIELERLCQHLQENVQLLFLANKQDSPNPMTTNELVNSLNLNSIINRKWHILPCSIVKNIGLQEGLEWVSIHLKIN